VVQSLISRLVRWWADAPFVIKILISISASIVTGSAFMAFISTYATYFYAFRNGARIPVEGVPFLTLTVAIMSFCIFTLASVVALIIYATFRFFNWVAPFPEVRGWVRAVVLTLFISLIIVVSYFPTFVARTINIGVPSFLQIELRVHDHPTATVILIFFVVGVPAAISAYAQYANRIISISYLALTLWLSSALFVPGVFDQFLRMIRHGGGIEVTIQRTGKPSITGNLFIYTAERVILVQPSQFIEIPTKDVEAVEYVRYPDWQMPTSSIGDHFRPAIVPKLP